MKRRHKRLKYIIKGVFSMCNSCFDGNCWWIILLIILFLLLSNNCGCGNDCGNNNCGCGC